MSRPLASGLSFPAAGKGIFRKDNAASDRRNDISYPSAPACGVLSSGPASWSYSCLRRRSVLSWSDDTGDVSHVVDIDMIGCRLFCQAGHTQDITRDRDKKSCP